MKSKVCWLTNTNWNMVAQVNVLSAKSIATNWLTTLMLNIPKLENGSLKNMYEIWSPKVATINYNLHSTTIKS